MKLAWLFSAAAALATASAASSSITAVVPSSESVVVAQFPTAHGLSTFKDYACTVDCEGHEAGYEWAEQKGIDDPEDCGGNSQSFVEGCRAYAEEQSGSLKGDEGSDDDEDDSENDNDDDE